MIARFNFKKTKIKYLPELEMFVNVHITEYYNKYNNKLKKEINNTFNFNKSNNKIYVELLVRMDDPLLIQPIRSI